MSGRARVAYIISAYRLPAMLVRLANRIDASDTITYVHVDARTPADVYRAMTGPLAGRERVRFLPRHACHWGDFGHVRATLKGLRALVESGEPFDYVVLLTGQDYPLRSSAAIADALGAADGRLFIDVMPIPNEKWTDGGAYRWEHRHFRALGREFAFPGVPFRNRVLNAAWSRACRRLRLYRTFPQGLEPWGGSSYWMMPADCARHIVQWVDRHPEFVRFFRSVSIPDEMFFHTIVMSSPFRARLAPDPLRYIDWSEDTDSPRVLTLADLPALRDSDALFARKFDPDVDATVLDRLDRLAAG